MEGEPKGEDEAPTVKMLAPALGYDFQVLKEMAGPEVLDKMKELDGPKVLLLGGTASPPYLRKCVRELEKAIPNVKRIEYPGLDHGATGNRNRRGSPDKVSKDILEFFSSS